jgi:hypothetical protein
MSNNHHDSKHTRCGCRGGRIYVTTMIKEAYVSFEIAKLLKEKGFDEPCYMSYWLRTKDYIELAHLEQHYNNYSDCMYAPTHQMAMAWLREVHKVLIVIDAYHTDHWEGYIDSFEIRIYSHSSTIIVPNEIVHHTDYTEAVEAALKYSLKNLI